jgi:signal transduction histidine kinase
VRTRIVGLALLAAVFATVLVATPFGISVARDDIVDERSELEQLANGVAIGLPGDLVRNRAPVTLPATAGGTELAVYDATGGLLGGHGPEHANGPVDSSLRTNHVAWAESAESIVVAVPITENNHMTGAIRAAAPTRLASERILAFWLLMLVCATVAVLISWLIALRLARNLARPLEDLSAKASRLGNGDFSVQAEHSGIPEIDSVNQSLNDTAIRIGGILERERAFSTNASHQLRTPLTGLRLSLETALDSPDFNPDIALRSAIESAEQLERTVDDLLSLARDPHPPAQPLEPEPVIRELHTAWQEQIAVGGRSLQIEIDPRAPMANAAPSAVRQILTVLIDNALKHGSGLVTVSARDAGEALAIDVADEGTRAELDERQIFQRRAEKTGSGIGLALARSLAEAEGGRLHLSQLNPTVFTLLLLAHGSPDR